MTDLIKLKEYIVAVVNAHKGMKEIELELKVESEFLSLKQSEYLLAVSELVQSNLIVRIEYQIKDNRSQFHVFYLPEGSRLV